jgi:hypothetical protein
MNKKYVVKLTGDERERYERLVHTGKSAAWKIQRVHALLKADQGAQGPGWDDARIAQAFGVTTRSLQNWRKQAVEDGPDALLEHQWAPRPRAVNWTVKAKRAWRRWPARWHRRAAQAGRWICWPTSWWSCALSRRFRVKQYDRR